MGFEISKNYLPQSFQLQVAAVYWDLPSFSLGLNAVLRDESLCVIWVRSHNCTDKEKSLHECTRNVNWKLKQFYSFPFPCSTFMLHMVYVCTLTSQFIQRWSTEKSIRQAGLRLVYYKQGLRRLSANKRKLVWKVLQTRLTLFVFFLCLSFGWWHPKIKFSSTCFGNIKNKTKKNIVNCTLVRWFILVCTVAWPDSNYTRAFITHHSV